MNDWFYFLPVSFFFIFFSCHSSANKRLEKEIPVDEQISPFFVKKIDGKLNEIAFQFKTIFDSTQNSNFVEDMGKQIKFKDYQKNEIPKKTRDRIFNSLLSEPNVIECQLVNIMAIIDLNNRSDSLFRHTMWIHGEKHGIMYGESSELIWGRIPRIKIFHEDDLEDWKITDEDMLNKRVIMNVIGFYKDIGNIHIKLLVKSPPLSATKKSDE